MKNINNPLNVTVSYCENHKDQNPTEVNLYKFLTDERFKDQVLALRNEPDSDKQRALKDALPACTVSGLFSRRAADSLKSATNLICIDIDAKDNLDISDLKERVEENPYVLFCAHSARGKGYFCIIRIADHKKFLGHFLSLERDFKRAGIMVDKSCKDINRLRYAFYDPEPYINLNALVYDRVIETDKRTPLNTGNSGSVPAAKISNAYHIGLLTGLLNGKDITENYDNWWRMACAIANEFGEAGRPMFHNISKNYAGYNSAEANSQYDNALRHGYDQISLGTVFKYAADNGVSLADYR